MNIYRIVLATLALVVGSQAKAELVNGNAVNCREAPAATARILQKLHRGQEVSVERYEGSWALLDDLECWASAAYLSNSDTSSVMDSHYRDGDAWGTSSTRRAAGTSGTSSARLKTSRSSASRSSFASTRGSSDAARSSSRSRGGYSGGSCPCGSGSICVGPRGGRYCITSGGNKRYGM